MKSKKVIIAFSVIAVSAICIMLGVFYMGHASMDKIMNQISITCVKEVSETTKENLDHDVNQYVKRANSDEIDNLLCTGRRAYR